MNKIYATTVVSPTHQVFLSCGFIESFPCDPNFELKIIYTSQKGNGVFGNDGWKDAMRDKTQTFLKELAKVPEDDFFLFVDPDAMFNGNPYDDLMKEIEGYDIVFQDDHESECCTGFFLARNNKRVNDLFRAIDKFLPNYANEQIALNDFLKNQSKFEELVDLKWKKLPAEKYWTYGALGKGTWDGTDKDFEIPEDALWVHYNWIKGIDDKVAFSVFVRNHFEFVNF